MKFCAVICEYNPFHNGHKYQLDVIRKLSGCDKILCLMSGNFTQRGEAAVFDKYTRARHAIGCGADVVLELPTAFSVCSAELFAGGAVHLLASLPAVTTLAFGCESGDKESFFAAATSGMREDKAFKAALKEKMKDGVSYVKARTQTILETNPDIDGALFASPNNMLGVEYCRAILSEKAEIQPLPILRLGSGYSDDTLQKNLSSATAIRAALRKDGFRIHHALKGNLPGVVFEDALGYEAIPYERAFLCALLSASEEEIARAPECSEGLENRLKQMTRANAEMQTVLEKVVSKRYTRSRVKRILAQNFLGVCQKDVKEYLKSPLYLRTLAVKRESAQEIFSALSEGKFPLVTRKSDALLLKKSAASCFELDCHANELYNVLAAKHTGNYETLFVD